MIFGEDKVPNPFQTHNSRFLEVNWLGRDRSDRMDDRTNFFVGWGTLALIVIRQALSWLSVREMVDAVVSDRPPAPTA